MTAFNFSKFLSRIAKKGDNTDGIIDARLEKARGKTEEPVQVTEEQLSGDYRAKKEVGTITEDLLEDVRTGAGDALVEGMLNSSKSTLHKHRNGEASAGDINKVEEQRLARKDRQEKEEQELANETGKKSRLLDNDTSKDDGLKLAGWKWGFTRTAGPVAPNSPDAIYYCCGCGQTYDENAMECDRCHARGLIKRAPGKYLPKPLDTSKPMPTIQSAGAQGKVVTAQWSWERKDPFSALVDEEGGSDIGTTVSDLEEDSGDILPGEDTSLTRERLKELRNPAFDLPKEEEVVDFSEDLEKEPVFEETIAGRTTATGTRMDIMEVACLDMGKYENEFGQLDKAGERQLVADVMAYLVEEHPEMRKNITPKMLNLTKIRDGKAFYLKPV